MSAHRNTGHRRLTNVTLPDDLLREARDLGINLSRACEVGLSAAVTGERRRRWLQDNHDALDEYNGYIERNGLPLEAYRQF
ncbi:MAG: type II toxin-antitoxin system CcdA family antitoxin [Janthinobacterium lividum]